MGEFKTYQCDECGSLKRESNHWFLLHIEGDAEWLVLQSLDDAARRVIGTALTLCSKGCVMVQVERFMQRVIEGRGNGN